MHLNAAGVRFVALCVAAAAFLVGCTETGAVPFDSGVIDSGVADLGGEDAFVWREAAPCPVARFESLGVVFDEKLWVMGGFVSADLRVTPRIDIYDPATDTWERGPDLRGSETHFGAFVRDGEIWMVGGFSGWPARVMSDVWRYRPATNEWFMSPPLPEPGAGAAVAAVDDVLYHVAGLNEGSNADVLTHYTLDLTHPTSWLSSDRALPNPRNHLGAVAFDGELWAIGGRHVWDEAGGQQASVHSFDPAFNEWAERPALPTGRSEIAASVFALEDGIVAIGGSTAGVQPTADVLFLARGGSAWVALPSLPEPRKGAVAAQIGNEIIVSTGSPTSTDPSAVTYRGCCLE